MSLPTLVHHSETGDECEVKFEYNLTIGWDDGMSDHERETFLNAESTREMLVGRFEACSDISKRFVGNPKGSVLAALVSKYYFGRQIVRVKPLSPPSALPLGLALEKDSNLVTDWGVVLIKRPPANDRNEGQSRKTYYKGIVHEGYNPEGRSPPVMKKVKAILAWVAPEFGTCFWSLASATTTEAWVDAKRAAPNKQCVTVTEKVGIPSILVHEDATDDVDTYIIREQNRWQDGSDFNVQQYRLACFF